MNYIVKKMKKQAEQQKKYPKYLYLVKALNSEYVRIIQLNIITDNPVKNLWTPFTKENTPVAIEHMKRCCISLVIKKMQIGTMRNLLE